MSKIELPDNNYTVQVKQLIEDVYPKNNQIASVYGDAKTYFSTAGTQRAQIAQLQEQLKNAAKPKKKKASGGEDALKRQIKLAKAEYDNERQARIDRLVTVAQKIISLCEADSFDETQLLSSKFLGTLMLITRGPERNFAKLHQRLKPLYKAVLVLRLTDKILANDLSDHAYLRDVKDALLRFKGNKEWQEKWQVEVAIPMICCALLQDIGLQSPEAESILVGPDNDLNEFRVLDDATRTQLIKINFTGTMDYLKNGLGVPGYVGNDKAERTQFIHRHTAINEFMLALMKDAYLSKKGVGEILKIPQVYTSIILSTKPDFTKKNLPKGYILIEQLAKKGAINVELAKAFVQIVGYFPLGFGVTYIPRDERGIDRDRYECAIVTRLNPSHPAEPVCRPVTRNLTYISSGSDEVVKKSSNLFFPANRKKLMRIGRERLMEIMSLLSGNFSPDAVDDLIPSHWEPADYFSFKKNQNLWNKSR
ncbi:hypothetical protein [Alteromonas gilva]|uniref:Uncharacterized protein n=1 Tax=Alteromonas gilva TaxID=2987522 RepID=A0ABT5KXX4_9ALTE|nr:hypothetical protein [Alteromonas gilva]MDC8829620.1 hypothetical protein [Alteromonas gilva]